LMRDPFPVPAEANPALVNARYGFGRPVQQTISFVVYYDGPRKPQPPKPTPDTGGALVVVVNNDPDIVTIGGLALRDAPNVNGRLIKRLAAGTELAVLGDGAIERTKIGVPNQWLNVATNGSQGFVAAWLVQEKSAVRALEPFDAKAPSGQRARARTGAPVSEPDAAPVLQPSLRKVLLVKVKRVAVKDKPAAKVLLRSKPSTGKIVAELKANAVLEVQESGKAALKKIGVRGKWVKVRDGKGNVGYVSGLAVVIAEEKKQPKAKG